MTLVINRLPTKVDITNIKDCHNELRLTLSDSSPGDASGGNFVFRPTFENISPVMPKEYYYHFSFFGAYTNDVLVRNCYNHINTGFFPDLPSGGEHFMLGNITSALGSTTAWQKSNEPPIPMGKIQQYNNTYWPFYFLWSNNLAAVTFSYIVIYILTKTHYVIPRDRIRI